VGEAALPEVHDHLDAIDMASSHPAMLRNLVSCAGAATCRLGICRSRGLAKAILEAIAASDLDLRDRSNKLRIHISGCPNSCGRHPIAQIGFVGAARKIEGRLVPHYVMQLGGHVEEGKTQLASGRQAVPAKHVPEMLVRFIRAFEASEQCLDFRGFLDNGGRDVATQLSQQYAAMPSFEEDSRFYQDWDSDELFSLAGHGSAECSADAFDLITLDITSAIEAMHEGQCYSATVRAARALLVTCGAQARDDFQALALFKKHFIDSGQVPSQIEPVITDALACAAANDPESAFAARQRDVSQLIAEVMHLYDQMDSSLRMA
jgi:sulfite reductase (ferredoxin)